MKRINNKGAVPVGLIIALVVVVAAAVVFFACKGFGLGGGNGDGEGSDIADNSDAVSVVEELEYINVTVSGNEYIYDNKKVTLDELVDSIKSLDRNLPVKIADEGSSLKAYKELKSKLSENNISFIEAE
ncbi:MAG: hypothetical protein J6L61_09730 [Ruminiclostridium sp.]|nr:hypothetical protein [Ruminiclostridium sp.]